jgi:hypothetical protein
MILQVLTPKPSSANIEFAKEKCCFNSDGTVDYSVDLLIRNLSSNPIDRIRFILPARIKGTSLPITFLPHSKKTALALLRRARNKELRNIICCSDDLSLEREKWVYTHGDHGHCECSLNEPIDEKDKIILTRDVEPLQLGAEIREWNVCKPKDISDPAWVWLYLASTTVFDLVPEDGQKPLAPASADVEYFEDAMGWFCIRFTTAAEPPEKSEKKKIFSQGFTGKIAFDNSFLVALRELEISMTPFTSLRSKTKVARGKTLKIAPVKDWTIAHYVDWRIYAYGNKQIKWRWPEILAINKESSTFLPEDAFPYRGTLVKLFDRVKRTVRKDRKYVYKKITLGSVHGFDAQTANWRVEWWHERSLFDRFVLWGKIVTPATAIAKGLWDMLK